MIQVSFGQLIKTSKLVKFYYILDIWHLCKNNPSIKSLKLTYCTQITNAGVRSALHMLNKLEVLDLEGIRDGGTSFFMDASKLSFEMSPSINFKNMKKVCFSGSNELNTSVSMRKVNQIFYLFAYYFFNRKNIFILSYLKIVHKSES